jgi:forespore regulator of the sigma-K checkpoint
VNDISPLLKMNGYFGLTKDGTLSIFNGKPKEADIIQSFFQIDVKKLESKHYQQLLKGIPVKSKEDFARVVETMKKYEMGAEKR